MSDEPGSSGISRRELLTKSAVAGGLVWTAPMVFASAAGATATVGDCVDCPDGRLFGLKYNNIDDGPGCAVEREDVSGGATCVETHDELLDGGCFLNKGVTFTPSDCDVDNQYNTHTYVLAANLQLCDAGGFGAASCLPAGSTTVTTTSGGTTVVISDETLSHSEIVFCASGSIPEDCPEPTP